MKRLYRSETDRMLVGVAGGMAEYFGMDPVLMRLIWVAAAVFSGGLMIVVYFVMAIVAPTYSALYGPGAPPPSWTPPSPTPTEWGGAAPPLARPEATTSPLPRSTRPSSAGVITGVTLVIVGGIALLANFDVFGAFNAWRLWPLILVGFGLALLFSRRG